MTYYSNNQDFSTSEMSKTAASIQQTLMESSKIYPFEKKKRMWGSHVLQNLPGS